MNWRILLIMSISADGRRAGAPYAVLMPSMTAVTISYPSQPCSEVIFRPIIVGHAACALAGLADVRSMYAFYRRLAYACLRVRSHAPPEAASSPSYRRFRLQASICRKTPMPGSPQPRISRPAGDKIMRESGSFCKSAQFIDMLIHAFIRRRADTAAL